MWSASYTAELQIYMYLQLHNSVAKSPVAADYVAML